MKKKEQIASLLARFMAAETTDQEERQLAEYFRTATDIPTDWQPYADMFQIFDEGATRLSENELESSAIISLSVTGYDNGKSNVRLGIRLNKWAASLALMLCLCATAATITYRAVSEQKAEKQQTTEQPTKQPTTKSSVTAQVPEEILLPDSIIFNNIPLAEIAQQITAIYGSKVEFADKEVAGLRLYFTLPKGSTVKDFVIIIDEYETLAATINGDTITIKKQEEKR